VEKNAKTKSKGGTRENQGDSGNPPKKNESRSTAHSQQGNGRIICG